MSRAPGSSVRAGEAAPLSAVRLDDPATVRRDATGRSLAYFCRRNPARVTRELIEELKRVADAQGGNVRLCLHESPEAAFHQMIILEHRGRYYRPHRHATKGEAYHLLEGAMAVFVFDERGAVQEACRLEPDGTFLYRIGPGMIHAVLPLTERVIYHECKPGPFLGAGDCTYPAWAPAENDPDGIAAYTRRVLDALGGAPASA